MEATTTPVNEDGQAKIEAWACMVHKLYVERVQEALTVVHQSKDEPWWQSEHVSMQKDSNSVLLDVPPIAKDPNAAKTGVSIDRRGYVLMLLRLQLHAQQSAVQTHFAKLSPMARQNVSWVGRLSDYCRAELCQSVEPNGPQANLGNASPPRTADSSLHNHGLLPIVTAAQEWYRALEGFDVKQHILRVQVHPPEKMLFVCRLLQQQAVDGTTTSLKDDPFGDNGGPLDFTRSKSRCTHRLNVVFVPSSTNGDNDDTSSTSPWDCYWGVEDGKEQAQLPLNHEASDEIVVLKSRNGVGKRRQPEEENRDDTGRRPDNGTALTTTSSLSIPVKPVSRAYFKLAQVWKEYLQPYYSSLAAESPSGAAVDLGAAPGGWTQVVAQSVAIPARLSHIVAVDAGDLYWTPRAGEKTTATGSSVPPQSSCKGQQQSTLSSPITAVDTKPIEIRHLACRMELADLQSHGPYSLVVCDASVPWMELFPIFKETVVTKAEFCLPCVWVLTLKLPHKRLTNVRRQLQQLDDELQPLLEDLATRMYPSRNVAVQNQVVHVMANTATERTLLAIFDQP